MTTGEDEVDIDRLVEDFTRLLAGGYANETPAQYRDRVKRSRAAIDQERTRFKRMKEKTYE